MATVEMVFTHQCEHITYLVNSCGELSIAHNGQAGEYKDVPAWGSENTLIPSVVPLKQVLDRAREYARSFPEASAFAVWSTGVGNYALRAVKRKVM